MPEHKKLEANGTVKIDPNDFEKAQSSEDEDPRASNSKLYADSITDIRIQLGDFKSSLEPLKKQLADLVDQNKQVQSSYAECEEKVKKLSEKELKVASPFEIFCNKTGVFFATVCAGILLGTFCYLWDSYVSRSKHEELERKIENIRSELNQNLKDLRRDFMKCYRDKIICDHQK